MTTVTPIQEPAGDRIRNAAQMASNWAQVTEGDVKAAFARVAALLFQGLAQLGEPNAAMLRATEVLLDVHSPLLRGYETAEDYQRYIRDEAALLLNAQMRGEPLKVAPREAPVELAFCSHCRDNAEFEWQDGEGWVSVCCTAPAIPVDVEPLDA